MTVGAHAARMSTRYSKRRRMESSSRGASVRASELRGELYELALLLELALDGVTVLLVALFAGGRARGLALRLLRLAVV